MKSNKLRLKKTRFKLIYVSLQSLHSSYRNNYRKENIFPSSLRKLSDFESLNFHLLEYNASKITKTVDERRETLLLEDTVLTLRIGKTFQNVL
jgi:hypothetical protein